MDSPLISVVIPNKNKGGFLRETVDSVIGQDYPNWELIVIDDHSEDESAAILEDISSFDSRICWHACPKNTTGGSGARNLGIRHAKGEFVLFLDSDDLLGTGCLSNRLALSAGSDYSFTVFPIGTFHNSPGDSASEWIPQPGSDHLLKFLNHNLPWHTMSVLWRRSTLEELQGFDERYERLQDVELHTRALLMKLPYTVFPKSAVDSFYRISDSRWNISHLEMCSRHMRSSALYTQTILTLTQKSPAGINQTIAAKAVQRTLLCAIHRASLLVHSGHATPHQVRILVKNFICTCEDDSLFTPWMRYYSRIFAQLSLNGIARVKGFQRLFLSKLLSCN